MRFSITTILSRLQKIFKKKRPAHYEGFVELSFPHFSVLPHVSKTIQMPASSQDRSASMIVPHLQKSFEKVDTFAKKSLEKVDTFAKKSLEKVDAFTKKSLEIPCGQGLQVWRL